MARTQRSAKINVERKRAQKLSVSISGESFEQLTEFCQREDRNPSWTINKLIERYLDKLEFRR